MNITKPAAVAIATIAVSGCADTPLSDADYGSSVQQMVQAQIFDPATAANPAELPPAVTDGQRLENAIDVYRKDIPKGNTEVKQQIEFEVGSN